MIALLLAVALHAPTEPEQFARWAGNHAIALRTTDPAAPIDDLEPLRNNVGDAHIVGLGEATHGTREFFQLKHRMLRFLVERMGFTVFAMEANLPEAFAIDEYIRTGRGDPRQALHSLYFWTWYTEEVLDMVEWMRRYNADPQHADKIRFYGFDAQFPTGAVANVRRYLNQVDARLAQRHEAVLALFATGRLYRERLLARQARSKLDSLLQQFDRNEHRWSSMSAADSFAIARQSVRILQQSIDEHLFGRSEARDRDMAENIAWIRSREGPDARLVLWAHNAHISRAPRECMGAYLADRFGSDYVAFGFVFGGGGFRAVPIQPPRRDVRTFVVPPQSGGTFDQALERIGRPLFFLDLRARPPAVKSWFASGLTMREIGAGFSKTGWSLPRVNPWERFDAIIFVRNTTASRPIATFSH